MSGNDLFGAVSTADTGVRSDNDFYESADWQVRALIHNHRPLRGCRVLECCSGRDAVTNVLRAEGLCEVWTNDIDPRHPAQMHHDARTPEFWQLIADKGGVDYVVTNPTFVDAFPILKHAVAHARLGVAFLLRKTFTEPTVERGPWLDTFPPTRTIGLPRHKFRGEATDSVPADWFIWERDPDRRLPPIVIDHMAKTRIRRLV